jgi:hypothetical protein
VRFVVVFLPTRWEGTDPATSAPAVYESGSNPPLTRTAGRSGQAVPARTRVPYDYRMQGIQLVILLTGATLGTAAIANWYRHRGEAEPWTRVLLGIVAGLVGLVLVLVPTMDLVVDDTETTLRVLVVVAVTLALIAGSIYRLTHR